MSLTTLTIILICPLLSLALWSGRQSKAGPLLEHGHGLGFGASAGAAESDGVNSAAMVEKVLNVWAQDAVVSSTGLVGPAASAPLTLDGPAAVGGGVHRRKLILLGCVLGLGIPLLATSVAIALRRYSKSGTLCPMLVTPNGTTFECCIPDAALPSEQNLAVDVVAPPDKGGHPIVRVWIREFQYEINPRIDFEKCDNSQERLFFLSTAQLWWGNPSPILSIHRPCGSLFGQFLQYKDSEYHMFQGQTMLLIFSGEFQKRNVRVRDASGRQVACSVGVPAEYKVSVQDNTDAGLVILGLIAVAKFRQSQHSASPEKFRICD